MEKFLEKFNIFDLFTMLIPGIIVSMLIGFSLSFHFYTQWDKLGGEKYILFFIFSYLIGVTLQEIGTIFDKHFLMNLIYGGPIREIYLLDKYQGKLFGNPINFQIANYVKKYILESSQLNSLNPIDTISEKEYNAFIYSYCTSFLEMKNLNGKADKMSVLSEMSRSLFYGFLLVILINLVLTFQNPDLSPIFIVENLILLILSGVFLHRKIRFEKYRLRIIFRTFFIYIKSTK